MKRILIALLTLVFMSATAQNNSIGKNDPKAKKILDKVTAKLKTYKSLKADFTNQQCWQRRMIKLVVAQCSRI